MRPTPLTRWLASLLTAGLLLAALRPAKASAAQEDAQTEQDIQDGITLRKQGNDEAALSVFLALERRNPSSVRVILHVTAAAQATGRWLLAYNYLRKAAAFKDDPYYVRNRSAVKSVDDAVKQHVGLFRVVGEPAGAEVKLSGDVLGQLPLAEPLPVELGSYTLEVSKPGFYQLRRNVVLTSGGALSQEVVELKPNAGPAPRAAPPPATAQRPFDSPRLPDRAPTWWESRSVTWALAGVTLAAAATSGIALGIREQKVDRWNNDDVCLDHAAPERTRQSVCANVHSAADSAGTLALTGGVVAAVFATATLTHWLSTPAHTEKTAGGQLRASCGAGLASITCSGTF